MGEKGYVAKREMLSALESGFFPQSVEYTESVSIAKQILETAPVADVAPKREVARKIFEDIKRCAYIHLDSNGQYRSLSIHYDDFDELEKKYTEARNDS